MPNSYSKGSGGFDYLTNLALGTDFDEVRAFELYDAYRGSGSEADLNAAFEAAVPSIRRFMRRVRRHEYPPTEFVSVISVAYYNEIKNKRIVAEGGPDAYAAALWWTCRRTCRSYIASIKAGKFFNRHFSWYCRPLPYGHVFNQIDVEHKIFLEELPKSIALSVLPNLRFKNTKYHKACKQILFNFLTNQKNFTGQICYLFDIPKETVKLLVDHVRVQIKAYIHEMRRSFEARIMEDWREALDLIHLEEYEEED